MSAWLVYQLLRQILSPWRCCIQTACGMAESVDCGGEGVQTAWASPAKTAARRRFAGTSVVGW